jgi:hypothetical protein
MARNRPEIKNYGNRHDVDAQHPTKRFWRNQKIQGRSNIGSESTIAVSKQHASTHPGRKLVSESANAKGGNLKDKQEFGPSVTAGLPAPQSNALYDSLYENDDGNHRNDHAVRPVLMREVDGHLNGR